MVSNEYFKQFCLKIFYLPLQKKSLSLFNGRVRDRHHIGYDKVRRYIVESHRYALIMATYPGPGHDKYLLRRGFDHAG